jgi:hypothetical protein
MDVLYLSFHFSSVSILCPFCDIIIILLAFKNAKDGLYDAPQNEMKTQYSSEVLP